MSTGDDFGVDDSIFSIGSDEEEISLIEETPVKKKSKVASWCEKLSKKFKRKSYTDVHTTNDSG
jgi:hypothetical protein